MKTNIIARAICLAPVAFAIAPLIATAGTDSKEIVPEIKPAPVSSWEYTLTPYGWLTGLDGTTGAGGITTDVDAPFFNDILDHIKMAAALRFEARHDKWGVILDAFYADLGADGSPRGPLYQSVSIDLKQFIGQAELTYRVYEAPKAFVDVFAGTRYNGIWLDLGGRSTTGTLTNVSANKQWVDPIIGFQGQYNFSDKWYLAGNADIGGFGVSSEITWSIKAAVGYNFTRNVSAELGYRYLYTDYQDGGFVFDMAQAGIYTGVNIRF